MISWRRGLGGNGHRVEAFFRRTAVTSKGESVAKRALVISMPMGPVAWMVDQYDLVIVYWKGHVSALNPQDDDVADVVVGHAGYLSIQRRTVS